MKNNTYWLPDYNRPIIAFDWDQTISINGHDMHAVAISLFEYLKNLGYLPVVISGRYPKEPVISTYEPNITIHKNPEMERFTQTYNPIRFKIWVLNYYKRKGDLIFYVDGDIKTVSILKDAGIPVINLRTQALTEWQNLINFWIKFFVDRKRKINK